MYRHYVSLFLSLWKVTSDMSLISTAIRFICFAFSLHQTSDTAIVALITLQDNTGLEGTSIPDTLCPYIESGLLHLSISCNIECTCCIDQCTTSSSTGGIV